MWLIDVFRDEDHLVAWLKDANGADTFRTYEHEMTIYAKPCTLLAQALNNPLDVVEKKTYSGESLRVAKITLPTKHFERRVKHLEKKTSYQVPLYNADIAPEDDWLFRNGLHAGCCINEELQRLPGTPPALKTITLEIRTDKQVIHEVRINKKLFTGAEKHVLEQASKELATIDPDVIQSPHAFKNIPLLDQRLRTHNIPSALHRYDDQPITPKGANTFYSYGQASYKHYGIRLRGRLLLDTNTALGSEHPDALLELAKLCGGRVQQLASRSPGSVFQTSLLRELTREDVLINHKNKPTPKPVRMSSLVEQDRAGIQLDAKIGVHTHVAEIDFTSMFPWLLKEKNISAETISTHGTKAPGVDVHVREDKDGYVAKCLEPFLEARLEYKANPTTTNQARAKALKSVLVSANGYLRYREFKLGLPATHVALCAWVRYYFLQAKQLAEERGYTVLHGLVDSLYIQKNPLDEREVQQLIWDIETTTRIPMEYEGSFKWIAFLPSAQENRPVPTRYYGALTNGDVKIRGLEARQKSQPRIIRQTQEAIIRYLAQHPKDKLAQRLPQALRIARKARNHLPHATANELTHTIKISKTRYKNNCAQAQALREARKHGREIHPGEQLRYVHDAKGIRLPEHLQTPDTKHYEKLLTRSLYNLLRPFNYSKQEITHLLTGQTTLKNYGLVSSKITLTA